MPSLRSGQTRNVPQYREIHRLDPDYGRSSEYMKEVIVTLCRHLNPKKILDFGCGKSRLVDEVAVQLNATAYRYDPAIEEFSKLPVNEADLVINTDVLEHLDEEEIDLLLADIASISSNAFFNISTRPAAKMLPTGENAHSTVKDAVWWKSAISRAFPVCIQIPSNADEARFITWRLPIRLRMMNTIRAIRKLIRTT